MKILELHVAVACMALLYVARADLLACCGHANSDSSCSGKCSHIFSDVSDIHLLSSNQFQDLALACSPSYHQLWACFNQTTASPATASDLTPTEVTQVTTPENYYCCDRAQGLCRETCKKELPLNDQSVAIQKVIAVCGPPPEGPMWECFLAPTTNPPALQPVNVDWARIQCCSQASASVCRNSCIQLYSGIITLFSWKTLQLDCVHRPSEKSLTTCLNDVSFPCKLGCSGLHFCSNFNNRPTMSFRQCSTAADHMAKNEYYTWVNLRNISHPLFSVLIRDIETCLPDLWKALACSFHVQPCHPVTHATQICRDDCIQLLSKCKNSTHSATAICDIITPAASNEHCFSLSEFTKPSQHSDDEVSLVTNPCDPNPCKKGFFCSINHLCRHGDLACSHYICQPGCSLGDEPSLVYPEGSHIRVPVEMLSSKDECFGFFNCTTPTVGEEVEEVAGSSEAPHSHYCEKQTHCYIGEDIYAHRSHFTLDDCNFCACFYGRVKCTNLTCGTVNSSSYVNCTCPKDYRPVCTKDGRTLPNDCIAMCLGYNHDQYKVGDCNRFNPCSRSSCDQGSRCMPNRRVCLKANNSMECSQHTCESLLQTCNGSPSPVCDASNSQHSTLCNFLRTEEEFGYHGYCREECSRIKAHPVCGVNGETFETVCHAESMHVAVDYNEQCRAVPGSGPDGSCSGVVCPSLSHSACIGVRPWSACCPKCGGHLTILIDETTLNSNSEAMGQVLSSTEIIRRLRHHITSLQCNLYGHVAADGSLSVLVLPVINASSPVVIKACNQEAIKLSTLINNRTPKLASDTLLSHLVAAKVNTSFIEILQQGNRDNVMGVVSSNSAHRLGLSYSVLLFCFLAFVTLFGTAVFAFQHELLLH